MVRLFVISSIFMLSNVVEDLRLVGLYLADPIEFDPSAFQYCLGHLCVVDESFQRRHDHKQTSR